MFHGGGIMKETIQIMVFGVIIWESYGHYADVSYLHNDATYIHNTSSPLAVLMSFCSDYKTVHDRDKLALRTVL